MKPPTFVVLVGKYHLAEGRIAVIYHPDENCLVKLDIESGERLPQGLQVYCPRDPWRQLLGHYGEIMEVQVAAGPLTNEAKITEARVRGDLNWQRVVALDACHPASR